MVFDLPRQQQAARGEAGAGCARGLRGPGRVERGQPVPGSPQATMNEPDFQQAYAEQNRRDYIASATLGTVVSIPLNLFCGIMDRYMYHEQSGEFFIARLSSVLATAAAWTWFKTRYGRAHPRYQVAWFLSPLLMILWMLYVLARAGEPASPYY